MKLPGKTQMLTAKVISFLVKNVAENRHVATAKGTISFQLLVRIKFERKKIVTGKIK